jgi:hypothetical protein
VGGVGGGERGRRVCKPQPPCAWQRVRLGVGSRPQPLSTRLVDRIRARRRGSPAGTAGCAAESHPPSPLHAPQASVPAGPPPQRRRSELLDASARQLLRAAGEALGRRRSRPWAEG